MRGLFGGSGFVLFVVGIMLHAPFVLDAQTVRCEFKEGEHDLIGTCNRVGERIDEETSRRQLLSQVWPDGPVRVTMNRVEEVRTAWSGTFFFDGWELPFTLEENVVGTNERRTVLRSELAWVLVSEASVLADDPSVFTFDANAYPLATDRDLAILETALRRLDSDWGWNRDDDRDCENDARQAASLFCLVAAAVEEHTGEYRHRQPALEVLRGVIRGVWPERLSGHPVMDFNNHPETTREDIREALARALEVVASEARGSR